MFSPLLITSPVILTGILTILLSPLVIAKTMVSGTISEDVTWSTGGSPYEVNNAIVSANATITVQPGVVVQFIDYTSLHVHGRIVATDTSNQKITFTSLSGATEGNPWRAVRLTNSDGNGNGLPSSSFTHCNFEGGGYWYGCLLEVSGGARVTIDQCSFRHSITDGIHFYEGSGGPISNSVFENNAGYGLWLRGSSPAVAACQFTSNANIGRLESGEGMGSFPAFTSPSFQNSGYVHIAGNIDSSGTLTTAPYYIDDHRVAAAGASITIQEGSTFAIADYATWTIHGNLVANGSASAPILFTSATGAREGNPWRAIRLTNADGSGNGLPSSNLTHCIFEGGGYWYACLLEVSGGASASLSHCTFSYSTADGARFFENSGGPITSTQFENNAGYGLWLRGSSPEVDACSFTDNGNASRLESGAGKGSFPAFTNTEFNGVGKVHIASNIDSSGTLTAAPYYLDDHRFAASSPSITIEGGATFAIADYATWTVHGNVIADGSENAPILFTSVSGASEGNPWRALRLTIPSAIINFYSLRSSGWDF
jgi:hypothetical protein